MSEQQSKQQDFVALVAAVTRVETKLEGARDDIREMKQSQDSYIIEHRATHAQDRATTEKQITAAEKVVTANISTGRKTMIGLLATLSGAVILDVIIRVVESTAK